MNKQTKLALLLFVMLGAGAFAVLRAPDKGERKGPRQTPQGVQSINPDLVDELEVVSGKDKTTLKKEQGHWMVTAPVHYPAEADSIKAALDKLGDLQWGDILSEQKEKQKEMEVDDEKGAHVVVKQGGKVLADLYFGKTVSGSTLVRPAGSNAIWQSPGALKFVFAKDTKGWRNKVVTDFKREDIETITVEAAGKGKTTIKRIAPNKEKNENEKFEVAESPLKIEKVDDAVVQGIASAVNAVRAADFADGAKPEETGLSKPDYTLTTKAAGKTHVLLLGKAKGENFYLKTPENEQVFLVPKFVAERMTKPPIEFRDKTLADIKADDVVAISIAMGDSKTELEKSGGAWKATKPAGLKPDESKVKPLEGAFTAFKATSFAETTDPKAAGLSKPTATVTVRTKDKKSVTFVVGAAKGEDYFIKVAGRPDVYVVKKYQVERFLKKPDDFKKPDATAKK